MKHAFGMSVDFRGCRSPASSLDFSGVLLDAWISTKCKWFYILKFLKEIFPGIWFQQNWMMFRKAGGVEWAHRLFITTEFHLWSLCSPWEWKVPLELCVVFFRSTELSHWNFLSCICVFVKLNAMAKQEAASFLRSRLKPTGTQPWFCVFKMGANLPPYLSPGFLTFRCHGP